MFTALSFVVGIAAGVVIQARRASKVRGTTLREEIQRGGGPSPVVPK